MTSLGQNEPNIHFNVNPLNGIERSLYSIWCDVKIKHANISMMPVPDIWHEQNMTYRQYRVCVPQLIADYVLFHCKPNRWIDMNLNKLFLCNLQEPKYPWPGILTKGLIIFTPSKSKIDCLMFVLLQSICITRQGTSLKLAIKTRLTQSCHDLITQLEVLTACNLFY